MSALFWLGLRRALSPAFVALVAAVLVFASLRDWGASQALLPGSEGARAARAAARSGVLTFACLAAAGPLLFSAGGTLSAWRQADVEWIATRAASPAGALLAAWGGILTAAALVFGAFGVAAEIAAGGSEPALGFEQALEHPAGRLLEGTERASVPLGAREAPGTGAVLLARLIPLPGRAPSADVRLSVQGGGKVLGSASARVSDQQALAIELGGAAPAELVLKIERSTDGAYLLLPRDSVVLCRAGVEERRGTLHVLVRLFFGFGAASALAFGFGAAMRGALAGLLALALWLSAWTLGSGKELLPGAALLDDLAWLAQGVAPEVPSPALAAAAALLACLGLALARSAWPYASRGGSP